MAATHDDAFREIQLSGKQLVFLFMAAVVIAVVIFLSGVQVGRGVMAERGGSVVALEASAGTEIPAELPPPPASARPGSTTEPVTSGEDLSYAQRLGGAAPPLESVTAASETSPAPDDSGDTAPTPRPEAAVAMEPTPEPRPGVAAPAAVTAALAEPAGAGFAIQVAALRERDEAEKIARQLTGKGFPAYVLAPGRGTPQVFRVRVGKYKERREADTIAARLQKEEQFKPWVVR